MFLVSDATVLCESRDYRPDGVEIKPLHLSLSGGRGTCFPRAGKGRALEENGVQRMGISKLKVDPQPCVLSTSRWP